MRPIPSEGGAVTPDLPTLDLPNKFDDLPVRAIVRAFGVEYGHVRPPEGGDLFVTRYGWPYVRQLLPAAWYAGKRYARKGERLEASTGCVYRLPTSRAGRASFDLVVKFSRVAQDVPLVVETTFPDDVDPEVIAEARFNSPMEEFGLVMELRNGVFGTARPTILTQRPLAIYAPPEEFEAWQLGRSASGFYSHNRLLLREQEHVVKAIELDIKRMYVLLYNWIKGSDAQEYYEAGKIGKDEFRALVPRVIRELHDRGFRVLDNKPRHFILRRSRRSGNPVRDRGGRLVYGLVDFELLQRTREHQRQFKSRQHRKYWAARGRSGPPTSVPGPRLDRMTIFGVDYLYGRAPDGGRLWVLGNDPDLFDYFMPERWRRTPRVRLSAVNEVYRTCTRDDVHVVYRRSRVGTRPRVDPLLERGSAIREHGYNSPFEEVAIAERLRPMGISTTVPRAIFRTAHRSTKARYLEDDRRFLDHRHVTTPEPESEPILTPDHDYYTISDYDRGEIQATSADGAGTTGADLEQALEDAVLGREEHDELLLRTFERLHRIGLRSEGLDSREIVLLQGADGTPLRTPEGEFELRMAIDALTAYDFGLLDDGAYRELVGRTAERLRAVDCEGLDPGGSHLLLSMDPDGRFGTDERGHVVATLSNLELIRGLYRPIR